MLHEPESVRVAVPKRSGSGPSFYSQSCYGVADAGTVLEVRPGLNRPFSLHLGSSFRICPRWGE